MTRVRTLALLALVGLILWPTVAVAQSATTPAVGLAGIAGKYERVWGFDNTTQTWKLYDPAIPAAFSDLTTLTRGKGYWLFAKEDATLVYNEKSYSLFKGWNLIGWLD